MSKTILLVDDESDLLTVTRVRLEAAGFDVIMASSGEEALTQLQTTKPDLLLLDLILPGIQGDMLCKKLKSDEQYQKMPIIIFTAKSLHFPDAAAEMGANDYLQKPFDSKELLTKSRKLI